MVIINITMAEIRVTQVMVEVLGSSSEGLRTLTLTGVGK